MSFSLFFSYTLLEKVLSPLAYSIHRRKPPGVKVTFFERLIPARVQLQLVITCWPTGGYISGCPSQPALFIHFTLQEGTSRSGCRLAHSTSLCTVHRTISQIFFSYFVLDRFVVPFGLVGGRWSCIEAITSVWALDHPLRGGLCPVSPIGHSKRTRGPFFSYFNFKRLS